MSYPLPVNGFWVSTATFPISRQSEEWFGQWCIFDRRPDLEENAEVAPLAAGRTGAYADERDADRAAKLAGRRRAQAMES
jgi:hypothetical protein